MKAIFYSTMSYERPYIIREQERLNNELKLLDCRLTLETASLAKGYDVVSVFVNDDGSAPVLRELHRHGVRMLSLRSAGFNHIDLDEAEKLGMIVARVPAYSPHAVAEHTVGLMLALNRKFHRAYQRVREQNFSLDGLMGFDMNGKTVGVVGTGKIGELVCKILAGFGCKVIALDPIENKHCLDLGVQYVPARVLFERSDIISLHCPLTPETRHFISREALSAMKTGVMIINTSRGAVIDTKALIDALKSSKVGSVGLDVYEEETNLFFKDLSDQVVHDDVFVRLMTFPHVLITAHQGFLTEEAISEIARVTLDNISRFGNGLELGLNQVRAAVQISAPRGSVT